MRQAPTAGWRSPNGYAKLGYRRADEGFEIVLAAGALQVEVGGSERGQVGRVMLCAPISGAVGAKLQDLLRVIRSGFCRSTEDNVERGRNTVGGEDGFGERRTAAASRRRTVTDTMPRSRPVSV